MNCYEILEVSQNASPEVIKAAYKSLMQRYHPDKNPGNAAVAAHALEVTQAYEVLSDANKRAAYNLQLKQHSADSPNIVRGRSRDVQASSVGNDWLGAKDKKSYWLLWFLIALTIGFSWFALTLLKGRPMDAVLSLQPEMPKKEADARVNEESARTIAVFLSDLTIDLKIPGESSGDAARVLKIPTLGITVGAFDADRVLRYIADNKELIRQKLEEKLVDAKYEDLIKADGEQYLRNMVMESIGDTTGTNHFKDDPIHSAEVSRGYGVVDVLLPRSYSVH